MKIKINDIKRKHPFKVDEEYFDVLSKNIANKTTSSGSTSQALFNYPKLALVFSILFILVSGTMYYVNINSHTSYQELIVDISQEEILDYLDYMDITEEELAALIPDNQSGFNESIIENLDFDVSSEELINEIYNLSDQI